MTGTLLEATGVDRLLLRRFEQVRDAGGGTRVILPEGHDQRIVDAARILRELGADPLVPGGPGTGRQGADSLCTGRVAAHLAHRLGRRGPAEVQRALHDPLALAMAAAACGEADAVVAGACAPTAEVMRTAFRVVGPAQPGSLVCSCFLMRLASGRYLGFGDCAVIPDPDAQQLAQIATHTAATFRALAGEEPRVAMLSFSTAGSAEHPSVEVVRRATALAREHEPGLCIDGELQFDAAIDSAVAAAKAPGSAVAGRANVLIFPNLAAGNIGYKITQRLAKARAYGPILQGLAAPVNDLSRGASTTDIVNVSLISMVQAQ